MPLFARWRAERDLLRKAATFVDALFRDPDPADVEWLAKAATHGDLDHARWELRYARRALGLITAQRDALDDRTASIVARVISESLGRDQNIAGGDGRDGGAPVQCAAQCLSRRAWRQGRCADPGADGANAVRIRRRKLHAPGRQHRRAGELLATYLAEANEALRSSFGAAALPEYDRLRARWSADRRTTPSTA